MSDNKKSKVFKCRYVNQNKKECTSTFTLKEDGEFAVEEHQHKSMEPSGMERVKSCLLFLKSIELF